MVWEGEGELGGQLSVRMDFCPVGLEQTAVALGVLVHSSSSWASDENE